MNQDDELTRWQQAWQSTPPVPAHLIRTVERQTMRMQALRLAEIGVTGVIGGGVLAGALVHPVLNRGSWLALATATWIFIVAAWVVSVRSTKGVWDVCALTTDAYVSLHVQRLRRQLDRILWGTLASVLFSVSLLTVVAVTVTESLEARGAPLESSDIVVFVVVGVVVNVFVVLGQYAKRQRVRAELARMAEIEQRLGLG